MNKDGKGGFKKGTAPGRPKGTKNKFTTLKGAFIGAFQEIGGEEALTQFAKNPKYEKEFFKMLAGMLPKDVQFSGSGGQTLIPPKVKFVFMSSTEKELK